MPGQFVMLRIVLRTPGALNDPFQTLWGSHGHSLVVLRGHGVSVGLSVGWEGAPESCGDQGATLP